MTKTTGSIAAWALAFLICIVLAPMAFGAGESCSLDSECAASELCARDPLSCAGPGTCEAMPEVCIELYDPVCGCDGESYSNSCYAAAARTGAAYEGECVIENDCLANGASDVCEALSYCAAAPGQCGGSVSGTCEPMPQACPYNWDPVCGCDGSTYANPCAANAEGVNVDHAGECIGPAARVPLLSSGSTWLLLGLGVSGVGSLALRSTRHSVP